MVVNNVKKVIKTGFSVCHFLFWFVALCILGISYFISKIWGEIDLSQFLFFTQTNLDKVDTLIIVKGVMVCVMLPLLIASLFAWLWYDVKKAKNKVMLCFLWYMDLMLLFMAGTCVLQKSLPYFSSEKTDFYQQHYVHLGHLKQKTPRNVILIFGESLETRYARYTPENLKIQDDEAIKFDTMTEGYAQRWTQGALFSAFTGMHIHFLSEYVLQAFSDKIRLWNNNPENNILMSNTIGKNFDFTLPNINTLGDIAKEHQYQTLFVQGGSVQFSGTKNFLEKHGFGDKDMFEYRDYKDTENFEKVKDWWGIDDKAMFALFKQKISQLDNNKPFLAVAFTLDLHAGKHPLYTSKADILRATINNFNDFIAWYKKQDFYDNTTLIIVGDHKRMGQGVQPGDGIYNAFFNLPEKLTQNLNLHRTFNQIDMFPTLLEIMGMTLPQHQAGMGTSLFSTQKTLAEQYPYAAQVDVFTKVDDFYKQLWSNEKIFDDFE